MDYERMLIHQADPNAKFIEWTTDPKPLLHAKYYNWSFIQVLKDILQNAKRIDSYADVMKATLNLQTGMA
jgi:hypothetical protein